MDNHRCPTRGLLLLVVFLSFQLAGCAFLRTAAEVKAPAGAPLRVLIDGVPFYAQNKYQCGPAALAMVLQWSGVAIQPVELVPVVYTPGKRGSLQSGLLTAARRNGRLAYAIEGLDCLIREVAAGRPVVVLQNLGLPWWPYWHYAVIVGYDLKSQFVVLHTGDKASREVGLGTFLKTWHRAGQWGLLVLSPGDMPKCVEETDYLKAAVGLQQAGNTHAALQSFSAAVRRWPTSVYGYLGLGNALYTDGSTEKAIQAFSKAVELEPANGPALNNLAHLLAESGDLESAEAMARRAVAVGGAHQEVYLRTLDEILNRKNGRFID